MSWRDPLGLTAGSTHLTMGKSGPKHKRQVKYHADKLLMWGENGKVSGFALSSFIWTRGDDGSEKTNVQELTMYPTYPPGRLSFPVTNLQLLLKTHPPPHPKVNQNFWWFLKRGSSGAAMPADTPSKCQSAPYRPAVSLVLLPVEWMNDWTHDFICET